MTRRLRETFRANHVARFYEEKTFGNDLYHVKLPFVHEIDGRWDRAIAPLNLGQQDTTRIIEHGGRWIMRVERLRDMRKAPERMLFVIHQCQHGKRRDAAMRISDDLRQHGLEVVPEQDQEALLDFARVEGCLRRAAMLVPEAEKRGA